MAGDPLSKEVSTPRISFIDCTPEVASYPAEEGVIGPALEPVSTSGRVSEEEEDEVAVNCADLRSAIIREDSVRIASPLRS